VKIIGCQMFIENPSPTCQDDETIPFGHIDLVRPALSTTQDVIDDGSYETAMRLHQSCQSARTALKHNPPVALFGFDS
jgi:hypothetical protein